MVRMSWFVSPLWPSSCACFFGVSSWKEGGSHPVREMVTYVTANFLAADVGIEFLRRHIPESVTPGYGGSGGVPLLNPSP